MAGVIGLLWRLGPITAAGYERTVLTSSTATPAIGKSVLRRVHCPDRRRVATVASRRVNQMKTRLQSLGLLDRALRATTDEELTAVVEGLNDDHREAMERLTAGAVTPQAIRDTAAKGRIDGTMESLALVLTDASLADCIEQLGDHSDNPTTDELKAVLPGIVERHGIGVTRLMLASTVAGEANASVVIRDLLKRDELVALPPVEAARPTPVVRAPSGSEAEREALRAKRQEQRRKKQVDARLRREQAMRARGRD